MYSRHRQADQSQTAGTLGRSVTPSIYLASYNVVAFEVGHGGSASLLPVSYLPCSFGLAGKRRCGSGSLGQATEQLNFVVDSAVRYSDIVVVA